MTIEHTEGDLQFAEVIHEANQFMIYTGPVAKWLMSIRHNGEQLMEKQRANLRRMVACWNACKGITTESLEANGVASFEQAAELAKCIKEQQEMMQTMLDALKEIGAYKGEGPMTTPWQDIVKSIGSVARAAIAKTKKPKSNQGAV